MCPLTWFAVNPDMTSALVDKTVNSGKSQPCSLPFLLGGKKGFEDLFHDIRRHAVPGITTAIFT